MQKIKVLVVDDSIVFRNLLVNGLNEDSKIEVVAQAGNAYAARDAILKYHPDIMTLDIEMPGMNGIEFLKKLIPQYPIPVVMVSALDKKVFDAMAAGAIDFVYKPSAMDHKAIQEFIRKELAVKVKIASTVTANKLKHQSSVKVNALSGVDSGERIIAIGASTGGTEAICEVLKQFGKDIPGVVVVQHMPPGFTKMYAQRLNEQCQVEVKEAETGDKVEAGKVLLAPGDRQMRLIKINETYQVECRIGEKVNGHCPSVDVLFQSVARAAGNIAIGVILTGMGGDGAKGLLEMREAGACTIGQNESSCIIYGMPKIAYDIGAVQYQMDLSAVAGKIYGILNK
ncbi:MAG: chemotaxis response regulator protein-glutamate methylesterase [Lachnospiraceae bacterium]